MAEHESIRNPEHRNHLTRRAALHGAAAVGALALPAGAAVAATSDADPGLAALEAGYRKWQKMHATGSRLYWRADDAWSRAYGKYNALVAEPYPAPVMPAELEPVMKIMSGDLDLVLDPDHPLTLPPHLLETCREYREAHAAWLDSRPPMDELLADDPDYRAYQRINEQAKWERASELRDELLAIPTTSPRGIMIKLAMSVGAENLDHDLVEALDHNDPENGLWPALLADLRAMVGANARLTPALPARP